MRTCIVSRPRATREQSSGLTASPISDCRPRTDRYSFSSLVAMLPISTSEWPPMYLVQAWMHRSTPCASAAKPSGLAQVLSIAVSTPRARAAAVMAGTSSTSIVTVPGDSSQIRRVEGRMSRSMSAPMRGG
ncbi:hypothetical protein D9M68_782330 [compost metagenome]